MPAFTVDTKLFRELGELLVAKESTALVELIKNAYDADATEVVVMGQELASAVDGRIVVRDNGAGMDAAEFERGFLRIAGRTKITADRRSPVFGRRFTGEKGVGRLAAHKLATKVAIVSRKAGPSARGSGELAAPVSTIKATIDWDAVEALETLDQVAGSNAVTLERFRPGPERHSGTQLTMEPLRKGWTERIKGAFLREAATLVPLPAHSAALPAGLLKEPLLFERGVPVRDQELADPGFRVDFRGELSLGDTVLPNLAQRAHWVAEIDFDHVTRRMRLAISPTTTGVAASSTAEGFRMDRVLDGDVGPSFRARILQISGKTWEAPVQGIRVYMEGFRVPPYGELGDDWLDLESDYKSRAKRMLLNLQGLEDVPPGLKKEELSLQGNSAHMGAVFLHRGSSEGLEMLVNREGFLPGPDFEFLKNWIRVATDLIVRLGYAARNEVAGERKPDRARQADAAKRADRAEAPAALKVRESALAAERQLAVVREAIRANDFSAAAEAARAAQPHFAEIRELSEDFGAEAVRWRVLASLGTELAAFVHEMNAIGDDVRSLIADLDDALEHVKVRAVRQALQRARKSAMEIADRIRRNAAYLIDSTSFEGRRRRSRQPLRGRLDTVMPFFERRLQQRRIRFENAVDAELRTPAMFPSELSGIFINLLSNAVKFTDEGGRIRVTASTRDGAMAVTMENTGSRVDLGTADRLFEAFRSTTERPDAVLGQGMGLGLTITRTFVEEYGGEISFVPPSAGFATAIRFSIPAN